MSEDVTADNVIIMCGSATENFVKELDTCKRQLTLVEHPPARACSGEIKLRGSSVQVNKEKETASHWF